MNELEQIVAAWEREDAVCVMATVVKTSGSTYRRPGAHMLLSENGWLAGAISGGCLERDVLQKSWWHTSAGRPALVVYDANTDDEDLRWGFGLGCNGTTSVLLERVEPGDPGRNVLGFARDCLRAGRRGVLVTMIAAPAAAPVQIGDRLCVAADGTLAHAFTAESLPDTMIHLLLDQAATVMAQGRSAHGSCPVAGGGEIEVFFELIAPARSLLICGSGFDVAPVVALAQVVGWHVTVADQRLTPSALERLSHADRLLAGPPERLADQLGPAVTDAAVVMTHNYQRDRAWLAVLLQPGPQSRCGYIGVLGPRQRTSRLLDELPAPCRSDLGRLHGPVGLDLGAEGAQEIALAIVAEVQATFAGRAGAALSPGGFGGWAPRAGSQRAAAERPAGRAEAAE